MQKIIYQISKNKLKYLIILVILVILRVSYTIYLYEFKYQSETENKLKTAMIVSVNDISEDKISYIVRYDKNKFLLNIYFENKYINENNINSKNNVKEKCQSLRYGDNVQFRGKITIPQKLNNPYEFDYKRYLNSNNICGTISTYDITKIGEKHGNYLVRFCNYIKDKMYKNISKKLPEKEGDLYKSMIYGDNFLVDESIKEDFKKIGLSHIMAVSGFNVSYVFLFITTIFNSSKENQKKQSIIYIIIILFYLIICGPTASLIRACIMSILGIIMQEIKLRLNKFFKISISAIILAIYNPYVIFNMGALLSYFSVLGIVIYQNEINSFFNMKLKSMLKITYLNTKLKGIKLYIYNILNKMLSIISFTISVQIMTFPITIYYFYEFSPVIFLSNLVISPILAVHGIVGFLCFFLNFIPFVNNILYSAELVILNVIIQVSSYISDLNIYSLKTPKFNILFIIFYYVILFLFRYKKKFILYFNKKRVKLYRNLVYLFTFVYILAVIFNFVYIKYFENYIYFFNVGQGNMAFIRYNRKNIVVDIGSTTDNLASNILTNFCNSKFIETIDMVLLTHMHTDHINGLENSIKELNVKNIVYNVPKEDMEEYHELKNILDQNNVPSIQTELFDIFEFDDIKICVLSPPNNECINAEDIANANSQVILITIKDKNFLFMGDATVESEKEVMENINNIQDDNLKNEIVQKLNNLEAIQIGHHGSKTSTSDEFLNYINVKEAIISSSKKVYGHPAEEVVSRLKESGIKVNVTENKGAIKYNL